MENKEDIKKLLLRYYEGESSLEEEDYLCSVLLSEQEIDADLQADRNVFRMLHASRIPLPVDMECRLEDRIDKHILLTKRSRKLLSPLWIFSVAASLIFAVILFKSLLPGSHEREQHLLDSYSNPKEAALVAQNTLFYLSTALNKGISGIEKTQEEFGGLNQSLNKLADLLVVRQNTGSTDSEDSKSID